MSDDNDDKYAAHPQDFYDGRVLPKPWIAVVLVISAILLSVVGCIFLLHGCFL